MISYKPLWETMEKKNISQYQLIKEYGFRRDNYLGLRKNNYVSTHTIEVLCDILDCKVEDIMVYRR